MTDPAFRLALLGRFAAALHAARRTSPERAAHLGAYVAAARGAFDRAFAAARALSAGATDRAVRGRASITAASILRQTGRHADAVAFDLRALSVARSADERAHALIGLAADAVGVGDAAACAARLAGAAACAPIGHWRAAVRLGWVTAEHRLLTRRPGDAARIAAAAGAIAARAGAARHEAKSLLFLGAALLTAGEDAAPALAAAEAKAVAVGAAPVARAAARLRPDQAGQYHGRR